MAYTNLIRACAFLATSTAVVLAGGCAYAPGMNVETAPSQFYAQTDAGPSDQNGYRSIPITVDVVASQVTDTLSADVPPKLDESWFRPDGGYVYHIGPQDLLSIVVWDHPELGLPTATDDRATAATHTVGPDGSFYFPYAGRVHADGLTPEEVRLQLTDGLRPYIKNPQVSVKVVDYRSQKVFVTGQVTQPGRIPLGELPVRLVDAVSQAGGPTDMADLRNVQLIRGERQVTVDLKAVFEQGIVQLNLMLEDGDIVHVGDRIDKRVFVMGEVNRPGSYYPADGRISLADALQMAGGPNQETSDRRRILVVRAGGDLPDVFYLDTSRPESLLLATRFNLVPQDVVFVAPAGLTQWNRVIRSLLPTTQVGSQVSRINN